jgi:transcriptional regulator with XRE-family HTH domain
MEKSPFSKEYKLFLVNLRNARKKAQLTQEQLAALLGETQSFISKVERGERRLDVLELRVFCRALKVPFSNFIIKLHRAITASERSK